MSTFAVDGTENIKSIEPVPAVPRHLLGTTGSHDRQCRLQDTEVRQERYLYSCRYALSARRHRYRGRNGGQDGEFVGQIGGSKPVEAGRHRGSGLHLCQRQSHAGER